MFAISGRIYASEWEEINPHFQNHWVSCGKQAKACEQVLKKNLKKHQQQLATRELLEKDISLQVVRDAIKKILGQVRLRVMMAIHLEPYSQNILRLKVAPSWLSKEKLVNVRGSMYLAI